MTFDPDHGFPLLWPQDHEKMEMILSERSDGSYGAPALQHAIHLDRKPFVALKCLFETMKIENLDYANAAILKADTLVKNSKTFAHSNDSGDNQRGERQKVGGRAIRVVWRDG